MKTPSAAPRGAKCWCWALTGILFSYLFNYYEKFSCNSIFERRFYVIVAMTLLVLEPSSKGK